MKKKIFFDLDGTLIDVSDRFYGVYSEICNELGIETLPKNKYWLKRQTKISTFDILKSTKGEKFYEQFITLRNQKIETQSFLKYDTLKPKVDMLLKKLSKKYTIHLISLRNSRSNLLWQLNYLSIIKYFKTVENASAFGGYHDKIKLIEKIGYSSGDWVVGDTESDILAGKTLNLYTCAVLNGMRTKNFIEKLNPHFIIKDIEEFQFTLSKN